MNKELKKTFFTSLIAVLLVISNLLGMKFTNFLDITISVDFVTFPFTFLCTLLIMNLGDKKDAYRTILVASIIQLLITISYALAVSLGNQTLMPDSSTYVNALFKVNEMNILGSVLAFVLSHCLLIYIYDNFKHYGKELYGLVIGLLGAMFLNSVVYLVISLRDYEAIFIINMLLSNIIVSVIMVVIITILFYILKEKENKVVKIESLKEKKKNKDLSMDEVIVEKNVIKKRNVNNTVVQKNSKTTTTKKNNSNVNNKKKNTVSNVKKSQGKVNKPKEK